MLVVSILNNNRFYKDINGTYVCMVRPIPFAHILHPTLTAWTGLSVLNIVSSV